MPKGVLFEREVLIAVAVQLTEQGGHEPGRDRVVVALGQEHELATPRFLEQELRARAGQPSLVQGQRAGDAPDQLRAPRPRRRRSLGPRRCGGSLG
jgi:hypothetical protein